MAINGKKIVMAGCAESGYETISFLLANGIEIDHFVTITEEKAKQVNASGYKDFSSLARQYGIPVYCAEKYSLKAANDQAFFQQHNFDILIQGGWQRLFPNEILETLSIGAIGIHGSSDFLPKGRGRSPINWSLIEGRKRFILQFFMIKPGVDDGDVFYYETFDINEWDTCRTLYYKNAFITARTILKFLPELTAGRLKSYPQQGTPTYYPKRTGEDGKINWRDKDVFEIYNFIRAITHPYPGAFCFLGETKIKIWKAQPFDTRIDSPEWEEGTIVQIFSGQFPLVKCRGGLLLITEFEVSGAAVTLHAGMTFT